MSCCVSECDPALRDSWPPDNPRRSHGVDPSPPQVCTVRTHAGRQPARTRVVGFLKEIAFGAMGLEPEEVLVRDVMTLQPLFVKEDAPTDEALAIMLDCRCRHLPLRLGRSHLVWPQVVSRSSYRRRLGRSSRGGYGRGGHGSCG